VLNGNPDILHLSDKSEFAIKRLFDQLLCPKKAVKLDNHIDVELLLLAVYKAYEDNFNRFQNWQQQDAFCMRVIGLIQSVLTPETAKMFCEGIFDVAKSIGPTRAITEVRISDLAKQYKVRGRESFYHSSRDSQRGLGFEFLCGSLGISNSGRWGGRNSVVPLGKTMSSKNSKFLENYAAITVAAKPAAVSCKS
jgi:hypothetical protein